ncbi:MAG: 30S ribosomal protein S8 [Candidatus Daviesbacteria bacterium]|nr:30S ribosomal protein S8 [Candidatus Daviesbacteria bacterium]
MDKVGDLLIRIKNGYMARLLEVSAPYSKLSSAICKLLKEEGFIEDFKAGERDITITLKYDDRKPVLTNVKRISKPGKRVYKASKLIPRVYNGYGFAIISTPKGILSDKQARKEGVGGEIMAYVW